jgi:predicted house-cleaning noncanonical NTP pyrophosphatase (MazG superfamily)
MNEKLVRDKIAEFVMKERGEVLNTRIANSEEHTQLLKNKLIEESQEVLNAKNKEELAEELGDLLEVMRALAQREGIVDMLFSKREAKFLEKGGFETGVVLIGDCKK